MCNISCPHCGEADTGNFSIACWVHCDNGEPAEACGDLRFPHEREPAQSAYCHTCGEVFGPRPGHVFRVTNGRPGEVAL